MSTAVAQRIIAPQEGPQTKFCSCSADIAIYGGAAGGGKSYGLLLEMARHVNVPGYNAVIFRRTFPMIKNPGGLWDTSLELYPLIGSKPREHDAEHRFPAGPSIKMSHMQHEKNKLDWMGAQICGLGYDELTHFTKGQFFYMLSRNRSTCGVRPFVRATCNPHVGWVGEMLAWWIDQETGFPIPEHDGVIRWMVRRGDSLEWYDTGEEALRYCEKGMSPKSVTFIAADVTDNKILMQADPGYLANLHALPLFERMQLLKGNWKVMPTAGMFFQRAWFEEVPAAPAIAKRVRYWDRAATEPTDRTDPDWTVGCKMAMDDDGLFYVEDVVRFRGRPDEVLRTIRNTATQDGDECEVWLEQDPGQAGVVEVGVLARALATTGVSVYANKVTKKKVVRAKPLSAQCEAGNVKVVSGAWTKDWYEELEAFADRDELPDELKLGDEPKDDQVDATSGAYNVLVSGGDPSIS